MQFQRDCSFFFYLVCGISDGMCLFMKCLLFMNCTTELCTLVKRSNTLLKNKEILSCDNCLGNSRFYIWTEGMIPGMFHIATAKVPLLPLHTCCSLVLLQRAPVSQWSRRTAEHSHFTLLNLSRMAFTPVAALSSNPGQTNAQLPETIQICSHIQVEEKPRHKSGI